MKKIIILFLTLLSVGSAYSKQAGEGGYKIVNKIHLE